MTFVETMYERKLRKSTEKEAYFMNRSIDRGWSKEKQKWEYGIYFKRFSNDTIMTINDQNKPIFIEVEKESVGRGTGKYTNVEEWFEGDIVSIQIFSSEKQIEIKKGVIQYGLYKQLNSGYIGFYIAWLKTMQGEIFTKIHSLGEWLLLCTNSTPDCFGRTYKMDIIGNLYEEKLKEAEQ